MEPSPLAIERRRPSDLRIAVSGPSREWVGEPSDTRQQADWPDGFAVEEDDRHACLVLSHLASLTPRRMLALTTRYATAREMLRAVRSGEAASEADQRLARTLKAEQLLDRLRCAGAELLTVHDRDYPRRLLDLADPPLALFVRGQPLAHLVPAVAIVGTRACSATGADVARALGRALAFAGQPTVSGGARGIDTAAHRGTLEGGGKTIVVMGCGIDVTYPRANRALYESAQAAGAVVSEYPPGTPPEPFRFPARNRVVAALARAVVIVEGTSGSGSIITADHALELGRDVFALPGAITNPLAEAPHSLIRDGATLIRGPDDLLFDLRISPDSQASSEDSARRDASEGEPGDVAGLTLEQRRVWEALHSPAPADVLASAAGVSLAEALSALVVMELRGMVRQVGGRFERTLRLGRNP